MLARMTAGVLGATLIFGSIGYGQQQPQGGPPDFAQMRQQMMDRLKDAMGATDDEWKVIQPKIEKVQQLQRQTGGRGPGMFGPPPGGPGGPGNGGGPGGPPAGGTDNAPGNGPGGPQAAARDNGGGPGPGGPPRGGPDGGFGGPGGPGGQSPSEVQQKQSDLRETLQNQEASPDELKAKVAALRDARARAKAQLAAAQEELRGLLSLRQEAVLVSFGVLE